MSANPPFALERATPEDAPEIVALEYKCFEDEAIRTIFMGCKSEADLPKLVARQQKEMQEDPFDIWIKVTDRKTGKLAAASNWKLFPGSHPPGSGEQPVEWMSEEEHKQAKHIMDGWNQVREACMPGPFLHLHICFTSHDYRRQGAGGMMLKWGCDLADQMFIPAWIESSPEGNFLYKTFGFYDYATLAGEIGGVAMKRDPKREAHLGGKAA